MRPSTSDLASNRETPINFSLALLLEETVTPLAFHVHAERVQLAGEPENSPDHPSKKTGARGTLHAAAGTELRAEESGDRRGQPDPGIEGAPPNSARTNASGSPCVHMRSRGRARGGAAPRASRDARGCSAFASLTVAGGPLPCGPCRPRQGARETLEALGGPRSRAPGNHRLSWPARQRI